MSSDAGDKTQLLPGFPIRKSSNHSLVIDYPRLIADSYVLHRFLVPRHPPCALKNLRHNKDQMLASTVQFSKHHPTTPHPTRTLDRGKEDNQTGPNRETADTRKPNSAPHATHTNQHPRYPHPPKGSTHAAPTGASHITDVPPTSKHPTPHTGMKGAPRN